MSKNSKSSDVRIATNRANSQKSTGPGNTSSTRFNAAKHGLLSNGVTELDDSDSYRNLLCRLDEDYAAEMSRFLIKRIALKMVRLERIVRLEAEHLTSILNPATYGEVENDPLKGILFPTSPLIDPGLPASISSETVAVVASTFRRYETSIENGMYRDMHEFERFQRIGRGEHLPAPVAGDVTHHFEGPSVDSTGTIPFESAQRGHEACTEGAGANDTSEQPPDVSE